MTRILSSVARAALVVAVPVWLSATPAYAQRGETRGSGGPAPSAPAPSAPAPASGGSSSGGGSTNTGSTSSGSPNNGGNVPPGARPRDGAPVVGTAVPRTSAPTSGGVGVYVPGYYGGYYDPWWYGAGAYGGYGYYGGYYDPWYGAYPDSTPQVANTYHDEGSLRLKIKPREAEVYVDGYYVGIVDDFDGIFQRLKIETGAHRVEIRAPGYEPLTFDVRISPDHSTTYQGELKKIQ